ncbi:hybrid sensor histidine kinase/response regulator [Prosthecobacter sp.]|uniref:hybrid sensor histidine kinase/response regulator n=1 Tax=Prosthecobacter sp. TaxID=1965333 RepID=UPI002AB9FC2A|nr:hybrid sensor histidine kinase/response regulator [Prosthecobacter sp.]MDZ4401180.1 hybrid sensor histidine kinase/response regulator [Prosthecobacter sp.]
MTTPDHETILIVDDQEENLRVIGNVLSMMAYDILLASNAEQALQRLAVRTPDLILLDVMMPETDGLTACRQIKAEADWADIPVIFLSADDDKNVIVQALEAGGVDYVTKPFNMAELVSRVRTQLALKRARDQLRTLAEDKDELMGIMAHDLKNSLAGMRLSACLLQSRLADLPPRCAPLVNNIVNASERMLAFMQEFLANQCAEQLQMKSETVNLGDVVTKVAANHMPAASTKKIALTTHLPKEALFVKADHEGLTQTLENLVSNAIKFSPEGGAVEITAQRPMAGMVKCFVRDTGPGFTSEDRTKMFRRYGRLSAQPTGDEPSTGLGLSIVKRLVDAMGGNVTLAESISDSTGAEFVIALPVASTKPEAE